MALASARKNRHTCGCGMCEMYMRETCELENHRMMELMKRESRFESPVSSMTIRASNITYDGFKAAEKKIGKFMRKENLDPKRHTPLGNITFKSWPNKGVTVVESETRETYACELGAFASMKEATDFVLAEVKLRSDNLEAFKKEQAEGDAAQEKINKKARKLQKKREKLEQQHSLRN